MKKKPSAPPPTTVVQKPSTEYSYGGLQLTEKYKRALDPRFLAYYAKEFSNKRMIYAHWTAGKRDTNFHDYHRVVTADVRGRAVVNNNTPVTEDLRSHTFGRNKNSCAVCIAGMHGATTNDLGADTPTVSQINTLVDVVTEVCLNLRIPVSRIMSHAEAADNVDQEDRMTPGLSGNDALPYGPSSTCERWDLHCFVNVDNLRLLPPTSEKEPPGTEKFMDWLRGQTALNIQAHTRKYWKGT